MKASKHGPVCSQRGSPYVLLPRGDLGKSCQEEVHTLADSVVYYLHV